MQVQKKSAQGYEVIRRELRSMTEEQRQEKQALENYPRRADLLPRRTPEAKELGYFWK